MEKTRALICKATDADATLAERHEASDELVRSFQDMAFACAYAARVMPAPQDAAKEGKGD